MEKKERVVQLDVRPYLKKKLEPFKLIMDTVSALKPEELLILHAPFKPVPLFGVMKAKGYAHKEEEMDEAYWIVAFARGDQAQERLKLLELRDLEKPADEEVLTDGV